VTITNAQPYRTELSLLLPRGYPGVSSFIFQTGARKSSRNVDPFNWNLRRFNTNQRR